VNALPDAVVIDGIERPTRNSARRLIHDSVEGIRNFWVWFGDSKVVDALGRPLVVYHGTLSGGFDAFEHGATGMFGDGIYFAKSAATASFWAGDRDAEIPGESEFGGSVYALYVKITCPADEYLASEMESMHGRDASVALRGFGHDGIVTDDEEIVVFEPMQIKSAIGNSGRFDPSSASLTDTKDVVTPAPKAKPRGLAL
jgi:hypothetical protein